MPSHSPIRKTTAGRHVFLVFTIRENKGKKYIRPISARYMHQKEVQHYEKKIPTFKSDKEAEVFVDTADITEYDLSGIKPVRFEFEKKEARVNMRPRAFA